METTKPLRQAMKFGVVLSALLMGGCESLNPKTGTPIPLTEDGALRAFRPIKNSATAPCDMQKEVAVHNSVYDTLKTKKIVNYDPPCAAPPAPVPAPKAAPVAAVKSDRKVAKPTS